MNNIKYKYIKLIFGLILFTSFVSCDEGGEPDPGKTTTGEFAGDWYIDITGIPTPINHALHSTYNTAANDNSMWIDDKKNGYEIKCKISIDPTNGTFSVKDSPNLYDLDTAGNPKSKVTITEGKIVKGGGLSKAGHTVDKITFKAYFSYDPPGTIIQYEGHKRTGFKEDEY
jgi:hypothetical protein